MLRHQRRVTLTHVTATLGIVALLSALFIVVQILFSPASLLPDDIRADGENQLTHSSTPSLNSTPEFKISGAARCSEKHLRSTVADVLESVKSRAESENDSLVQLLTKTSQFKLPDDEGGALNAALHALCTNLVGDVHFSRIDTAIDHLSRGDPEPAISIFSAFIKSNESKKAVAKKQVAVAMRHLGSLRLLSSLSSGTAAYQKAAELDPANALNWQRLGVALYLQNETQAAMKAYQHIVELGHKNDSELLQAAGYGNLGWIGKNRDKFDTAVSSYHKALAIFLPMGDAARVAKIYRSLAWIHKERSEWSLAQDYHRKSIVEYEKTGKQEGIANAHRVLGWIEKNNQNLEQSETHFIQSLDLYTQLNDSEGIASTSRSLGGIYKARGELDQAQKLFEQALISYEALQDREGLLKTSQNLQWVMDKVNKKRAN